MLSQSRAGAVVHELRHTYPTHLEGRGEPADADGQVPDKSPRTYAVTSIVPPAIAEVISAAERVGEKQRPVAVLVVQVITESRGRPVTRASCRAAHAASNGPP